MRVLMAEVRHLARAKVQPFEGCSESMENTSLHGYFSWPVSCHFSSILPCSWKAFLLQETSNPRSLFTP